MNELSCQLHQQCILPSRVTRLGLTRNEVVDAHARSVCYVIQSCLVYKSLGSTFVELSQEFQAVNNIMLE